MRKSDCFFPPLLLPLLPRKKSVDCFDTCCPAAGEEDHEGRLSSCLTLLLPPPNGQGSRLSGLNPEAMTVSPPLEEDESSGIQKGKVVFPDDEDEEEKLDPGCSIIVKRIPGRNSPAPTAGAGTLGAGVVAGAAVTVVVFSASEGDSKGVGVVRREAKKKLLPSW